ncbi:hypothetical protein [Streptomyces sp. TS71-3]|uniref:hypothetical protein n=1 Tax=Streptomyces sp. TS71-3 TaxID=2733862 RepID=UPI001B0541DE|nr:hypothetical protein [Streptomyces sp. TS71-3]GHJ35337.1 hypothetical protein Sm713_09460 [Streptomyces sp. TS71-3]
MEQRKDLKIQPVQVASTDPAFISGLMPSGRDEPEDQRDGAATDQAEQDDAAATADADGSRAAGKEDAPEDSGDAEADQEPGAAEGEAPLAEDDDEAEGTTGEADEESAVAEATEDTATEASGGSGDSEVSDASDASGGSEDSDATDTSDAEDGGKPAFEAKDRRGSIAIDADGVRFTLDDQAAEWTWEEIAAVEYETTRFTRRLTVTAHTPDRRWYPAEVQAPDKSALKEWTARLDEVLDAYFEEESVHGTDEEPDSVEPEDVDEPASGEESASAEEPSAESAAESAAAEAPAKN